MRDAAVGDLPAVQAASAQGRAHGVLDGPEERERHRAELDLEPERHAAADRRRVDPQPDGGQERVAVLLDQLDRLAAAGGPLDADRGRLAEADLQAVLVGQGRLDDLLLHLAVERQRELRRTSSWRRSISGSCSASWPSATCSAPSSAGRLGTTTVSRVGGAKRCAASRRRGCRRRRRSGSRRAPTACRSGRRRPRRGLGGAAVERRDRGDLALEPAAEAQPLPGAHGAGEHAHVGDLLARRAALDLEHRAGRGRPGVGCGRRQQRGDAAAQRVHAGAGDGRPEEHRVHQRPPGLRGERPAQPALRQLAARST